MDKEMIDNGLLRKSLTPKILKGLNHGRKTKLPTICTQIYLCVSLMYSFIVIDNAKQIYHLAIRISASLFTDLEN